MKRKILGMIATILVVMAVVLSGCSGPVSLSDSAKTSTSAAVASAPGTGNLEIRVTDAPAKQEITKIDVTVKTIEIKKVGSGDGQPENITEEEGTSGVDNTTDDNSGWTKIKFAEGEYPTFDLLTVKNNPETLSSIPQEVGSYKIRLEVESVMVTFDGKDPVKATVPSGKIRFSSAFEITEGGLTILTLDFDASRSVNVTGNGKGNSKVMFKPVIKLSVIHENKGNNQDKGNGQTKGINITTDELPDGVAGEAYNATLAAAGGSGEYTWELISGALPDNLTLNAAGKISGEVDTDAADDEYQFTVRATDKSNASLKDTQKLTLVINEKLAITTASLPAGLVGQAYDSDNATLAAVGGSGDYSWDVTAGTLPDNLTLSDEGVISGTPGAVGSRTITITVTDSSSPVQTADKEFTITINAAA